MVISTQESRGTTASSRAPSQGSWIGGRCGRDTVKDMKFTVRRAEPGDAAAIAVCLAALGYATPPAVVADKLSTLGSPSDTVLVAEDPAIGIVGVVSVHLVPLFHAAGNLARLTALAVVPGHQRKGVGRALVAAAEAFAWQRDCRRVEVTSGDHREDAHTFYRALGYEMDERRFIKHRSPAV